MPESNRHHHTRGKDYSGRDRNDEGGREHRQDRRHREDRRRPDGDDRSRSHRDKQRDADTQRDPRVYEDTRHHSRGVPSYTETLPSYYEDSQSDHHTGALYTLKYITTSRGICQAMEFFLSLLIIICAGVNHSNSGRYRDIASLGGLYQYYYGGSNAFIGAEAQKVQQLDDQFYRLKLPPYVYSMALGGALMLYAGAMLALGVFRMPYRFPPLLLAEALSDALIGLGFIPALAFYFIKLQEIYNNSICKEREAMYSSKGHRGFECNLNGADIAGGLFGVLGIIIFPISAVLAIRAFRSVRKMKSRPTEDNNL
ncbi:MARVEL domain-containing protein 3 [Pimephales promelas]|uniref:MARVEL domain-containing protein 3 n=1 Tax=Pimephales promelas TaxID=90988 RepID=UPI00195584DA|nr:MARVEL domain-containing protein 3 [Pimephales promelas]KAG1952554.1 MARVEL domain-containing protein [Pimephales promelas]